MNAIDNIEVSMKDCNGICENSFASYSSNENESRSYETETVETDLHFESFNNITSSDMHVNMQNDTKIIGLKDNMEKDNDYLEDDSDPLTDYRNSVWKKKSTKLLLTLYKEYKNEFCDYTKKKKYIWQAIAEKLRQEGYFVTADSCDTKWRNMLKTYRKTVKYNEQRNVVPRKCPFFDEIDDVLNEQVANRQIKETLQIKKENYGYLIQKTNRSDMEYGIC
ncbi:uncharacterized protein [Centruroides vittatus]|uniref:uncharacterized protein n=1 Tax=Centruroides vittatus TaxID=120091 RepID=UPI0035102652